MTEKKITEAFSEYNLNEKSKNLIKKYAGKEHPLDKTNWFDKLLIGWATPFIKIGNKMPFNQNFHPNMPREDDIDKNLHAIKQHYGKGVSLSYAIYRGFRWRIFGFLFLGILKQIVESGLSQVMYGLIAYAERSVDISADDRDFYPLIAYFSGMICLTVVSAVVENYNLLMLKRLSIKIQSGLEMLIFEKIMRFSTLNSSEHNEGNITNYVNVDALKIRGFCETVVSLFECCFQFTFCFILGLFIFDWTQFVFIGVFQLGVFTTSLFLSFYLSYERSLLERKDKTMLLLKNCLNNIKFVKMMAWENFYFKQICERRNKELQFILKQQYIAVAWNLIGWSFPTLAYISIIGTLLGVNRFWTLAEIQMFSRINNGLVDTIYGIPQSIQLLLDMKISVTRIDKFLNSQEIDTSFIEYAPVSNLEEDLAINFQNANFYWRRSIKAESEEEIEDKKLEIIKEERESSFISSEISIEKTSENGEAKKENNKDPISFKINEMNQKIEKGSLTMIIGKIGSGKSSLFNSFQGEMNMMKYIDSDETLKSLIEKEEEKNKTEDKQKTCCKTYKKKKPVTKKVIDLNSTLLEDDPDMERIVDYNNLSGIIADNQELNSKVGNYSYLLKPKLKISGSLSYLPQKPWLQTDTIKANIIQDREYSEEKLTEACILTGLTEDIKQMKGGIEKNVGDGGDALSGGQRSRVALAACIYQNPDIQLLDDPLSALDTDLASYIMEKTLKKDLEGKTRILITHCVQHLKHADYVYILDEGKIVMQGKFEDIQNTELINKFRELEELNLSKKKSTTGSLVSSPVGRRKGSGLSIMIEKGKFDSHIGNNNSPLGHRKSPLRLYRKSSLTYDGIRKKSSDHDIEVGLKKTFSNIQRMDPPNENINEEKVMDNQKEDKVPENFIEGKQEEVVDGEAKFYDELFMAEDRETGKISFSIVKQFFKLMGGVGILILAYVVMEYAACAEFYGNYWLYDWAENYIPEQKWMTFTNWSLFQMSWCTSHFFRAIIYSCVQMSLSRKTHRIMLFKVLHAKIDQFLDRVPTGRIINRFSKDMDSIDNQIIWAWTDFLLTFCYMLCSIGMIIYTTSPWLGLTLIPVLFFALWFQNVYMSLKRELIRLESSSRSPILSIITDSIRGLPIIRSLKLEGFLRNKMKDLIGENFKNALLIYSIDSWYQLRSIQVVIFIVQIPSYTYIILFFKTDLDPSKLALTLFSATEMIRMLLWAVRAQCQFESTLISFERCTHFQQIDSEKNYKNVALEFKNMNDLIKDGYVKGCIKEKVVDEGKLIFDNVSARYNDRSDFVIKNISFNIKPKEKIGIIGRSGAGKSSLIKILWNCLAPCSGKILVDGQDISECDLKDYRSQIMVISQETALFEGSLRENIDPLHQADNSTLMQIMAKIEFKHKTFEEKGLNMEIEADGGNLSQGEKQLICFSRTLINKRKQIIFDEATANIDLKTEEIIQSAVKKEFEDSTMLIIAHRIQTIIHCDRIMVLDHGSVVDFDTVGNLMKKEGSYFKEIYEKNLQQGFN